MKTFTIKDFLQLNSPCFGCDGDIDIRIGVSNIDTTLAAVYLKPSYALNHLTIPLVIKYESNLKLIVDCKTNKFATSDTALLTQYLEGHKLYVQSRCSMCLTTFTSDYLEFNLQRQYIKPFGILRELIISQDRKNKYQISSDVSHENTWVTIFRLQDGRAITQLELPIMHRHRFKDRHQLMNKLKTYLVFS